MGDYYDSADLGKFSEIGSEAPELWDKFLAWYNAVFAAGALGEREKLPRECARAFGCGQEF